LLNLFWRMILKSKTLSSCLVCSGTECKNQAIFHAYTSSYKMHCFLWQ
jgi:hypothetical protein